MYTEIENLKEIEQVAKVDNRLEQSYPEVPTFAKIDEGLKYAPPSEIQAAEIRDVFLEVPEFRFENWEKLSAPERAEALNKFEEKIAEIEMRNPLPVQVERLGPGIRGLCDGQTLKLSESLLSSNSYEDYRQTFETLFHEGRHAYQFYNLDVCRTERSDNMVDSWRANLSILGYESGNGIFLTETAKIRGYYRYASQPIEVDARQFAEDVIRKLGI